MTVPLETESQSMLGQENHCLCKKKKKSYYLLGTKHLCSFHPNAITILQGRYYCHPHERTDTYWIKWLPKVIKLVGGREGTETQITSDPKGYAPVITCYRLLSGGVMSVCLPWATLHLWRILDINICSFRNAKTNLWHLPEFTSLFNLGHSFLHSKFLLNTC